MNAWKIVAMGLMLSGAAEAQIYTNGCGDTGWCECWQANGNGASYACQPGNTDPPATSFALAPTAVPEIDPSGALAPLVLLVGGLAAVRGRHGRK